MFLAQPPRARGSSYRSRLSGVPSRDLLILSSRHGDLAPLDKEFMTHKREVICLEPPSLWVAEPGLEPWCIHLSLVPWFLTVTAPRAIQSVLQGVARRHLDLLRLFRRSQDVARLVTTTVPFALMPVSPPCWVLSWVFQTCQLKAWGHPWTTKSPSLIWLYCFIPNPYSKFTLTLSPAQIGTTLMFSIFIKTCRVLHAQIDETVQRFLFHYSFSTCLIFRSVCAAIDLLVSYSLWASALMGLGRHQSPPSPQANYTAVHTLPQGCTVASGVYHCLGHRPGWPCWPLEWSVLRKWFL